MATNIQRIFLSQDHFFFTSVQFNCHYVQLFATPWTVACQASLSIINSQSVLKLMSIESLMPSNHLILCHPPLLLPAIFPSTRVFFNESVLHIWWPKYWSFSFGISPSNEYSGLISWIFFHIVSQLFIQLILSPLPLCLLLFLTQFITCFILKVK